MKLWLVLYAAGQVGGSWGPLPYGIDECKIRRDGLQAEFQSVIDTGRTRDGRLVPADKMAQIKGYRLECEERAERPVLGSS